MVMYLRLTCLLSLPICFGFSKVANAHFPEHAEWNDVINKSRNQSNDPCCGLSDAHLVEFDEWRRRNDGVYEVHLHGQWYSVEDWKVTTNTANPTGKAIVWYAGQQQWERDTADPWEDPANHIITIYCFKPLEAY
jgi:hypothetical protein